MAVSLQLALQYLSFKYTASSCGAHCRFHFCKLWTKMACTVGEKYLPDEDISKIKNSHPFIITAHGMWTCGC